MEGGKEVIMGVFKWSFIYIIMNAIWIIASIFLGSSLADVNYSLIATSMFFTYIFYSDIEDDSFTFSGVRADIMVFSLTTIILIWLFYQNEHYSAGMLSVITAVSLVRIFSPETRESLNSNKGWFVVSLSIPFSAALLLLL